MRMFATMMLCLMMTAAAVAQQPSPRDVPQLWVYAPVNFQVDRAVDELIDRLGRARKADYSAAVITDYKFGRIDDRPSNYYANLARTRAAADKLGIELIPCVMPIGYSGSILINDPNLAEGLPVREQLYLVHGGQAFVADTSNHLPGGDFESAGKNAPSNWDWIDGFGKSTMLDRQVKHSGASSLKMSRFLVGNDAGNCRVVKAVAVKPWHQYVMTLWIKSKSVTRNGDFHVQVLTDGGRALNYANLGVKPTQGWTEHHIVFNSLDHDTVRVYIGQWGGGEGTYWIDDVELRVAGAINLIRREGCPVRVTSAGGKIEYEEGRDFKRWVNEDTGMKPWPGNFTVMTGEPAIILTANSRIVDGQPLAVSYYHAVTVYDGQVACCLTAPGLYEHLSRQIELIKRHIAPKRYFMQHDELRVAGWCELCAGSGKTAGQLLADNVRRCTTIIHKHDPKADVIVWSDMFDPHHNARDNYYLVSSTLAGSWEGLDPVG